MVFDSDTLSKNAQKQLEKCKLDKNEVKSKMVFRAKNSKGVDKKWSKMPPRAFRTYNSKGVDKKNLGVRYWHLHEKMLKNS